MSNPRRNMPRRGVHVSILMAAGGMVCAASLAIDQGAFALTGRNAQGVWMVEEPIQSEPVNILQIARTYCGRTFYANPDTEQKLRAWVKKGFTVSVEYVSHDGLRRILCAIR